MTASCSPESLQLLLRLLEASVPKYTASTLAEHHGSTGQELIRNGLVRPAGFDRSIVADDGDEDRIFSPVLDHDRRELGFFHPLGGWTKVAQASLQRYEPDLQAIFGMLLGEHLRALPHGPIMLVPDIAWAIGKAPLTRAGLTEIWFARRMSVSESFISLKAASDRAGSSAMRLVLTSSRRETISTEHIGTAIVVPIADVIDIWHPSRISMDVLKGRYCGRPVQIITESVHLSADDRVLTILGQVITTFRRDTVQGKLARQFVNAYQRGERLRAQDALVKARSGADSIDQAFGVHWPKLKPWLRSKDGWWGFEL